MERIDNARDLKPGDVLVVDVTLTDKHTGQDRVWRRYACVLGTHTSKIITRTAGGSTQVFRNIHRFTLMTLKMHIDEAKDIREIDLREGREICYLLPEDKWPQGVIAMRMKHIHLGRIKLQGND